MEIKVKKLVDHAQMPIRNHFGDAGADLTACIDEIMIVDPGEIVKVPTGIAMAIGVGYVGSIRPRSGISTKTKLRIPNSPGTIDSQYRGEIIVPLENIGTEREFIRPGLRIAQLLIERICLPEFTEVHELMDTKRGKNRFGSTD